MTFLSGHLQVGWFLQFHLKKLIQATTNRTTVLYCQHWRIKVSIIKQVLKKHDK